MSVEHSIEPESPISAVEQTASAERSEAQNEAAFTHGADDVSRAEPDSAAAGENTKPKTVTEDVGQSPS
jgi:hypothetical protein